MGHHIVPFDGGKKIPNADRRVRLCHNAQKAVVWLELTVVEPNSADDELPCTTHFIGAVQGASGWEAITPERANQERHIKRDFGSNISNEIFQTKEQFKVSRFQRAIINDWMTFDGRRAKDFAKGLTFGHDLSSPSFVMKALKTGFDAIGANMHAYQGLRNSAFTVDDVIEHLNERTRAFPKTDHALPDFEEFAPLAYAEKEEKPQASEDRLLRPILSERPHGGNYAYAAETAPYIAHFPRVRAYGFRGDSRPPAEIMTVWRGFSPNYTRDQAYQNRFKDKPQDQALNLTTFLDKQEYGGYISVSKSVRVARAYACNLSWTHTIRGQKPGWVYACFVEGAFEIPKPPFTLQVDGQPVTITKDEQELSFPGALDWDDIVGCRKVTEEGWFQGNILLRRSLLDAPDKKAGIRILKLLSGKRQS